MDLTRFKFTSTDIPWIAVFLDRVDTTGFHTGIVYRDGKGILRRLDLGWHRWLIVDQQFENTVGCAIPLLDPIKQVDEQFIAGLCGKIARSTPNRIIPYGLKIDVEIEFDAKTGEIKFGKNFTGLNCATFVAAVFRSAGNMLIDTNDWPAPNNADIVRQTQLVELLERSDRDDNQRQASLIKPEIGLPRISPEHVAGACLEDSYPVAHAICDVNARRIVELFDARTS